MLAAKTVNGIVVRNLTARELHETYTVANSIFYLATKINVVQIAVQNYFQKHTGMIRACTAAFVGIDNFTYI
jgi:hypothetical protein